MFVRTNLNSQTGCPCWVLREERHAQTAEGSGCTAGLMEEAGRGGGGERSGLLEKQGWVILGKGSRQEFTCQSFQKAGSGAEGTR